MVILDDVVRDLLAEGDAVEALVVGLPEAGWRAPTPSAGWTVAHQIGHLAWTDDLSLLSATDPEGFARAVQEHAASATTAVDDGAAEYASKPGLLADWRRGRRTLAQRLREVPAQVKLPWFGPPMNPASMATVRIMETWAHGLDVADALGEPWPATRRLKHVAHIGVRARGFAYLVKGLAPPAEEFRVELTAPDGEQWAWGPADAAQRVTGSALDFCYLVCQRRPRAWLDVRAEGEDARQWLSVARAFAGPPGSRRAELVRAQRAATRREFLKSTSRRLGGVPSLV